MTQEKFYSEVTTLHKFIALFCTQKHTNRNKKSINISYKNKDLGSIEYELCNECEDIFLYSISRLNECPHEEKPRCRKCPDPCYEKLYYRKIAKIMAYSGMRLGLIKLKKRLTSKRTN